jgi:murein DD-endopeptidase MepM/ murein hydrolase activator NlpD
MLPTGAPVKGSVITSKYGDREHPLDGKVKPHTGIDFSGGIGTPLYAVAPGKVIFVGDKNGYGKAVVKVKVTLKNGKTKTVKMTIKVTK